MSTSGRNRRYYDAEARHEMLKVAAVAMECAIRRVNISEDSGAMFRIREMLQRTQDEVTMAEKEVEMAARDL